MSDLLELLDWKRRVFALYAEIRAEKDPELAWERWRDVRAILFREHPQSPRPGYADLACFDYDPAHRYLAEVVPAEPQRRAIGSSGDEPVRFTRFATARFGGHELELYWLDAYGGGLFLPFRDATAGGETYGAGRYRSTRSRAPTSARSTAGSCSTSTSRTTRRARTTRSGRARSRRRRIGSTSRSAPANGSRPPGRAGARRRRTPACASP